VRAIEAFATPSDIATLLKVKSKESDFYVKKRLQMLIEKISQMSLLKDPEDDDIEVPFEIQRKIKSEAIEWVAGLLLHEIGSRLGLLESALETELPNYPSSITKKRVENLQDTFDGIEQLKRATLSPRPTEMDLASFIGELITLETESVEIDYYLVGRKPMIIYCDRSLLTLALCNGIKNAIEASLIVAEHRRPVVTVSWGTTDRDYWVTVNDTGPGVLENTTSFNLGESSKAGHLGFGLGIAKQAMDTMRGEISLKNSSSGGTVYELRWSLNK
jgi:signal transduction histidine kinase